jgi:hypothetical protein
MDNNSPIFGDFYVEFPLTGGAARTQGLHADVRGRYTARAAASPRGTPNIRARIARKGECSCPDRITAAGGNAPSFAPRSPAPAS